MEPKSEACVICKDGFGDDSLANIVCKKGLETPIPVEEKEATKLPKCLLELKNSNQEVKVHYSCRRKFTPENLLTKGRCL